MIVREIKEEEIPTVGDIWLAASKKAHHFIDATYWEARLPAMVDKYLPLAKTYVADSKNGKIMGFISIVDKTNIAAIFIDPSAQGQGIGSRLIDFVKQQSSSLSLKVYSKNLPAHTFYKKHGFIDIEEMIDEATGEKEVLMEWHSPTTD